MSSRATHPWTEVSTPSLQFRCLPHSPVRPLVISPLGLSLNLHILLALLRRPP
ncbi:hypothetical protein CGRA01v4_08023 [Colletotrichum graminicola]|nr:hypothetical protein CGRA01v4_08023 [Colletotrichum graminicola]